jgi:hypothetical protein
MNEMVGVPRLESERQGMNRILCSRRFGLENDTVRLKGFVGFRPRLHQEYYIE